MQYEIILCFQNEHNFVWILCIIVVFCANVYSIIYSNERVLTYNRKNSQTKWKKMCLVKTHSSEDSEADHHIFFT